MYILTCCLDTRRVMLVGAIFLAITFFRSLHVAVRPLYIRTMGFCHYVAWVYTGFFPT